MTITATTMRSTTGGTGSSIRQMPTMVEKVFTLPDQAAAITRPLSTAMRRRPLTANSRTTTMSSAQAGIRPTSTNHSMADITSILSASGSMNLPKSVTMWSRRAR